jgi:hypothetical protein
MRDKEIKKYLRQSLHYEINTERLEETIQACTQIMREQNVSKEEPRLQFFGYLSNIFRFEGIHILMLQTITLLFVCFIVYTMAGAPKNIPIFMPFFVWAIMPTIFKVEYYGMSEIEAATRTSGAQIVLAKLILAGAANLVSITVLLCLEVFLQDSYKELGQMVLYCVVPYLVCMVVMLHLIRLRKRDKMQICGITILGSCVFWSGTARAVPWLYETSATGIWVIAFLLFALFFVKEIVFILKTRKEGKMYGIVY